MTVLSVFIAIFDQHYDANNVLTDDLQLI